MKQIKIFLLCLFSISIGHTLLAAQKTVVIETPANYYNTIVSQQDSIGKAMLNLLNMFSALPEDKSLMTKKVDEVVATCQIALAKLGNLEPIPNEFGLAKSAKDLFQFYLNAIDKDYREMIDELYMETPDMEKLSSISAKMQLAEKAAVIHSKVLKLVLRSFIILPLRQNNYSMNSIVYGFFCSSQNRHNNL